MATSESDWARAEVEATVDDYLRMMTSHLTGQAYNKAAHRRALRLKLNHRTDASVEFKHRNISAVMLALSHARNRSLGAAGEDFVVEFERHRLHTAGAGRLADRIEHLAATKGDGLGYDVASFDLDGKPRFIEVKTTAFAKETPFYISRNELGFSDEAGPQFHLYRLFEFRDRPRMFDLAGPVRATCHLTAESYLARFD